MKETNDMICKDADANAFLYTIVFTHWQSTRQNIPSNIMILNLMSKVFFYV